MRLPRGRLSLPPLTVEARLRDVNRPVVVPPSGRPARAFRASTATAMAMATARFFVRMGHVGGKKVTHARDDRRPTTTVVFPGGHFRASSLSVYPARGVIDLVYSVTDL